MTPPGVSVLDVDFSMHRRTSVHGITSTSFGSPIIQTPVLKDDGGKSFHLAPDSQGSSSGMADEERGRLEVEEVSKMYQAAEAQL